MKITKQYPADYVKALKGLGKNLWKELGGGAQYLRKEHASWQKKVKEIAVTMISPR